MHAIAAAVQMAEIAGRPDRCHRHREHSRAQESARAQDGIGGLAPAKSDRAAISCRALEVARLELQAGADAGESACPKGPLGAWRHKSPQPAPHSPAAFPRHGWGRRSVAFSDRAAFCSAPFLLLRLHVGRDGPIDYPTHQRWKLDPDHEQHPTVNAGEARGQARGPRMIECSRRVDRKSLTSQVKE
jgi:hypothetical protein